MTVRDALKDFYRENNIPEDGGMNDNLFIFKVFGLTLKLPNPEIRRKNIYIHDIQHVVHQCDTSWKGESYIAGWEIGTNLWRHFPLVLLPIWAMGYGVWTHPKEVFRGYKDGLKQTGIIDLELNKEELLEMNIVELKQLLSNKGAPKWSPSKQIEFLAWILLSQFVLLSPIIMVLCLIKCFFS